MNFFKPSLLGLYRAYEAQYVTNRTAQQELQTIACTTLFPQSDGMLEILVYVAMRVHPIAGVVLFLLFSRHRKSTMPGFTEDLKCCKIHS
jgi:hypothetical protein